MWLLMSVEAVKRGRGRPRKDGQPNKSNVPMQKNPDCEPATKGYVKCIARKFYQEQIIKNLEHRQGSIGVDAGFWFIVTIMFGVLYLINSRIEVLTLFFISLALLINALIQYTGYLDTIRCSGKNTDFMEKYVPPEEIQRVCEVSNKKKECEE